MQRRDTETAAGPCAAYQPYYHRLRIILQSIVCAFAIVSIGLSATVDKRLKNYNESHPAGPEASRWAYIMTLTFSNVTVGTITGDWVAHIACGLRRAKYYPIIIDVGIAILWIIAIASVGAKGADYGIFSCADGQVACGLMNAQFAIVFVTMIFAEILAGVTVFGMIKEKQQGASAST